MKLSLDQRVHGCGDAGRLAGGLFLRGVFLRGVFLRGVFLRGLFLLGLFLLGLSMQSSTPVAAAPPRTLGKIERFDPAVDRLLPKDAVIEVLADGFEWSEGPVWDRRGGCLLFSDIPHNRIHKWDPQQGLSIFLTGSGYTGEPPFTGPEPGSNGLTFDAKGRLVMCCHGDRAIKRQEADGTLTVLASHYRGKRLNSPNDLVYHSQHGLYFTDPPYGLPKRFDDPARELDWCGVYRLTVKGEVELLSRELDRPNGIAFSPDERTLYVAQSDRKRPIWMAFPVTAEGTLGKGRVFADASPWAGKLPGGQDGMAVDRAGNLWATGPGGVMIFSPDGKLLGRITTGQRTANCAFGEDGKTLFITADAYLCRVRTSTEGILFGPGP